MQTVRCGCLGECGNGPNVGVIAPATTPHIRKGVCTLSLAEGLLEEVGVKPADELVKGLKRTEKFRGGNGERADFEKIVEGLKEWKGGYVIVLMKFGEWLRGRGELQKGVEVVNEILDIDGGCVDAWVLKARMYEEMGEREMAAEIVAVVERMVGGKEREEMRKWGKKLKRGRWLFWGK